MGLQLAQGQVWKAEDRDAALEVADDDLNTPTAPYDSPVYISVEIVEGRHPDIVTDTTPPRIERDTLLRQFSLEGT